MGRRPETTSQINDVDRRLGIGQDNCVQLERGIFIPSAFVGLPPEIGVWAVELFVLLVARGVHHCARRTYGGDDERADGDIRSRLRGRRKLIRGCCIGLVCGPTGG